MEWDIYQVDAFTNSVFGGNPAAACLLSACLRGATLPSIASEKKGGRVLLAGQASLYMQGKIYV